MHKKGHKLKTSPLIKNSQFSSNLAGIQVKLPTHEAIIVTKFHKECKKIVDFLPRQTILLVPFLMHHPSPSWILKAEGVENLILYFELLWNIKQQQVARAKKGLLWMGCVQKMAKWMANNHNGALRHSARFVCLLDIKDEGQNPQHSGYMGHSKTTWSQRG